jgi:hypothetical protein
MEFPITRERLQNFQAEYKHFHNEKFISKVVESITHKIFEMAGRQNGMNPIRMLQITARELYNNAEYSGPIFGIVLDNISQIISKLQERFPGTTITIDPMKTYLYIDWS